MSHHSCWVNALHAVCDCLKFKAAAQAGELESLLFSGLTLVYIKDADFKSFYKVYAYKHGSCNYKVIM